MRFFCECRYHGGSYYGWQSQNHSSNTIQGQIERAFSTILRTPIRITGCGRTDSGVHASFYVFHVDMDCKDPEDLMYHVNAILPKTIVIDEIYSVVENAHARYSALFRTYEYRLVEKRDPFRLDTTYYYPKIYDLKWDPMFEFADIIFESEEFYPFCKTDSGVKDYRCDIKYCSWNFVPEGATFRIVANRFLRGMVRLLVGASINVGREKLSLEEVKNAIKNQKRLSIDWSVPASGLFLTKVEYPFGIV